MRSSGRFRAGWLACLTFGLGVLTLSAHRQDECLQAALIDVGEHQVRVFLSITPGTEVAARFEKVVDADGNGSVSELESATYATNAVKQLSLQTDGVERRLELKAFRFPEWDGLRLGTATIQVEAEASVPVWSDGFHRVRFENRHLTNLSVYVTAALQPETNRISIGRQQRNDSQSTVELRVVVGVP